MLKVWTWPYVCLLEDVSDLTVCMHVCSRAWCMDYGSWLLGSKGGVRLLLGTWKSLWGAMGGGPVSKPDLRNQCPYKRANDKIRRMANIGKWGQVRYKAAEKKPLFDYKIWRHLSICLVQNRKYTLSSQMHNYNFSPVDSYHDLELLLIWPTHSLGL